MYLKMLFFCFHTQILVFVSRLWKTVFKTLKFCYYLTKYLNKIFCYTQIYLLSFLVIIQLFA